MNVVVASPKGGQSPLDPGSVKMFGEDPSCTKFLKNHANLWEKTAKLSEFVGRAGEFEVLYYVGGNGCKSHRRGGVDRTIS